MMIGCRRSSVATIRNFVNNNRDYKRCFSTANTNTNDDDGSSIGAKNNNAFSSMSLDDTNAAAGGGTAGRSAAADSPSSIPTTYSRPQKQDGIVSRLYNQYGIRSQQDRIVMADRLFQFAQWRADDPLWYGAGHIGAEFRPRHAMITMHLWFLQKRLIRDGSQNSLLTQEELFEVFWDDTRKRIRAEGLAEMSINKHLTDIQQYTFQHLTHYDHAFQEFELRPKAR